MDISKGIRVVMPGKGEVMLRAQDHLATGGEGAVFQRAGMVYKLYLDPVAARARGMEEKIGLLAQLRHPCIVAPIDVLRDQQQALVGHYMPAAPGVPLIELCTNAWRNANGFGDDQAAQLVENMRAAVTAAHALPALMVDGNETNWLANGVEPRVIDVDSWQIGRFPATAMMATIRDYHGAQPSPAADWFAWGIVTFQVFMGIHPYKGSHPDFRRGDLEARMRANVSVFDPRTRLNAAVRHFAAIPAALRDWYADTFQRGLRGSPPSALQPRIAASAPRKYRATLGAMGRLQHEHVLTLPGTVRWIDADGLAVIESEGRLQAYDLRHRQALDGLAPATLQGIIGGRCCLLAHQRGAILLEIAAGTISAQFIPGPGDRPPARPQIAALPLRADRLLRLGRRVFAVSDAGASGLAEIRIEHLGERLLLAIGQSWPVHARATRFFDGLAVWDCLGTPFILLPEGPSALLIDRAEVLRDYRLINAYARDRHAVVMHGLSRDDGLLYRLRLRLGKAGYELIDATVVYESELNVAVTARGVAVALFDDGEVTVWNTAGDSEQRIADRAATRDLRLFALADGVYYLADREVFRLRLGVAFRSSTH
ncbi:MAG: hypothetical protein V5B31_14170 [Candidatus Accumulibacter propinquus]|jgi:hypothetical protein|uniref:hypothetical protein n=1 Tax=Candidatus Accumulibacter propinquus TaxID=2954380 RepID=UPI002FC371D8